MICVAARLGAALQLVELFEQLAAGVEARTPICPAGDFEVGDLEVGWAGSAFRKNGSCALPR